MTNSSTISALKKKMKCKLNLYLAFNRANRNLDRFKNKIFGLYQRFHQQYPSIEGKGLGLFIIKSQIEAMDGKIEVESILDQGTTFRIYFHNQHLI